MDRAQRCGHPELRGTVDAFVTLVPGYRPTAEEIRVAISAGAVSTGSSGCDYGFQPGRQYLIYARRTPDGRWTTSRCDGTKPLEEAAADLDYIGGLSATEPLGRVYGKIERTVLDETDVAKTLKVPATGITIALTGKSNRLAVTTNEEGTIDVRVPPDEYTITPVVPQTVRVFGSPIQRRIGDGERKTGFTIVVKPLIETTISGGVVFADDSPVSDRLRDRCADRSCTDD